MIASSAPGWQCLCQQKGCVQLLEEALLGLPWSRGQLFPSLMAWVLHPLLSLPGMVPLCRLTCGAAPSQGPVVSRPGRKAPLCSPFPRVVGEGLWRKNKQILTHPSLNWGKVGWGIPFPSLLPRMSHHCWGFLLSFWTAAQQGPPALLGRPLPLVPHAPAFWSWCLSSQALPARGSPCPAHSCLCSTTTGVCKQPPNRNNNCGWSHGLLWTLVVDGSALLSCTRRPAFSLTGREETLISFAPFKALFT